MTSDSIRELVPPLMHACFERPRCRSDTEARPQLEERPRFRPPDGLSLMPALYRAAFVLMAATLESAKDDAIDGRPRHLRPDRIRGMNLAHL